MEQRWLEIAVACDRNALYETPTVTDIERNRPVQKMVTGSGHFWIDCGEVCRNQNVNLSADVLSL